MPTVNKMIEALEMMRDGGHGETHVYFISRTDSCLLAINSMSVQHLSDNKDTPAIVLDPEQNLQELDNPEYEVRKHLGDLDG